MRYRVCVAFVFSIMLCMVGPALAQSPWYVEGSAGALWRMNASDSITITDSHGIVAPGTNTNTYSPGPVVNLGLGYRLPLGFRVEAEFGYAHYDTNTISPLNTTGAFPNLTGGSLALQSSGGHDQYSGTFNAFYDFSMFGRFVPYVGAGVGGFSNKSQAGYFTGPGVPLFTQFAGSSTHAGVIAEAGVAIGLDAKWAVVPSYRFQYQFTSSPATPNEANIFKLGLRYSL
jgi:opacity protein-like surface antigen